MNEYVETAHSKYLAAQRVYRLISSPEFDKAVQKAKYEDKLEIKKFIDMGDYDSLKQRIRQLLVCDLESLSLKELRIMGRRQRIKNWNSMGKSLLISQLEQRINNERDDFDECGDVSTTDEAVSSEIRDSGAKV